MKTRPYFLMNFPPVWTLCLFYFLIGASYLLDVSIIKLVKVHSDVFMFAPFRQVVICFGAFVFGVWRCTVFYPYPAGKYGKWLTLSPWRYGMSLPKGAVQLNLTDLAVVAMLCLTTLVDEEIPVVTPLAVFLYTYIIVTIISTINGIPLTKYWKKKFLILLIIPLAFYPGPSINSMLISLAVCYLLCRSLLRDVLKEFPWNQNIWLEHDEDVYTRKSLKYLATGWPYSVLGATEEKRIRNKMAKIILLNLLIVWYLHAIIALNTDKHISIFLSLILCYVAALCIIIRMVVYLKGTAPPISFLGRIMNGYFIIPKYDRVFLAPLFIVVFVIFTVYFMPKSAQYASWAFEGAVFIILCISLGFPPGISQWRNTGAVRLVRSKMQENKIQQTQARPQGVGLNKPLGELLIGK